MAKPNKDKRFIVTEKEMGFASVGTYVLVDKQTGVNYLWTAAGYAGGLTVLVDAEGKPIVTPVPKDED